MSALRFLFLVTLKRRDLARALVITRYPRKLPEMLSVEEAARLLETAPTIKYKAALGVARQVRGWASTTWRWSILNCA